jgi:hypothetical protein
MIRSDRNTRVWPLTLLGMPMVDLYWMLRRSVAASCGDVAASCGDLAASCGDVAASCGEVAASSGDAPAPGGTPSHHGGVTLGSLLTIFAIFGRTA